MRIVELNLNVITTMKVSRILLTSYFNYEGITAALYWHNS